ncbi:hypothetical protein ZWY2020_007018 [Hordeum vulgare]|nr:hypothetical protein ZWY2020_007018 [Hordeum vulgare]
MQRFHAISLVGPPLAGARRNSHMTGVPPYGGDILYIRSSNPDLFILTRLSLSECLKNSMTMLMNPFSAMMSSMVSYLVGLVDHGNMDLRYLAVELLLSAGHMHVDFGLI